MADRRCNAPAFLAEQSLFQWGKVYRKAATMNVEWLSMEDEDRRLIAALSPCHVSYLPRSWDKRFIRNMEAEARHKTGLISKGQRESLWRMLHRYRRLIPAGNKDLLDKAEAMAQTELEKPVKSSGAEAT